MHNKTDKPVCKLTDFKYFVTANVILLHLIYYTEHIWLMFRKSDWKFCQIQVLDRVTLLFSAECSLIQR